MLEQCEAPRLKLPVVKLAIMTTSEVHYIHHFGILRDPAQRQRDGGGESCEDAISPDYYGQFRFSNLLLGRELPYSDFKRTKQVSELKPSKLGRAGGSY